MPWWFRLKEEINKKIEEMNKTLEDLNKVLNDESGDSLSTLKDKFIAFLKEKFGISLVQFDLLDRAKDFVTSAKQNGQAQDSATVKVGDYGVKGDLSYKDGKLQGSLNLFGGKQQQKTQAQPQKVQTPSQPIVDDSEDILVKPTQTQTVQSQPQKVQSQPQTQSIFIIHNRFLFIPFFKIMFIPQRAQTFYRISIPFFFQFSFKLLCIAQITSTTNRLFCTQRI